MKLVTFHEGFNVTYRKSAGMHHAQLDPMRPYIFSAAGLNLLFQGNESVRPNIYRFSSIDQRITAFNVSARKVGHQRLLLYNGSSGYGDQIMTWPLGKLLHDMGFEVSILVDPGNQPCWQGFPWVRAIHNLPMSHYLFQSFDYHAMFQSVVNTDEHQDQRHPLDVMLARVGIDPSSVLPTAKVLSPVFTHGEVQRAMEPFPGQVLAMYQLCTSVINRSLTPDASAHLLGCIAKAFPTVQWLGLYDEHNPKEYALAVEALRLQNVAPYCHPVMRELWAMVASRAAVVVSPDSLLAHVAGSCGVPCVGLWGPTAPQNRVLYYSNHHPIYKTVACPHSPCYHYSDGFPRYCPKKEQRTMCDVMSAISPEDVIAACRSVHSLQVLAS